MYWRGSAIPVVIHRVGSGGWDPLCRKGNIAIRHGKLAVLDGYGGFPAIKSVAFSGRICLYGVGVAFVHIVHEGVVIRPAATIQNISHLMFFHISAVEGNIVLSQLVIRLECDLVSTEITIQIPAAESILAVLFGLLIRRHICCRHRRVDKAVHCLDLNRSGIAYILHLKVDHNYVMAFNFDITVKVHIRGCAVVFRNLCGLKPNFFHVIRRDCASEFFLHTFLVACKDRHPYRTVPGHNSALVACRPGDDTAFHIEAVFIICPCCARNIDRGGSKRAGPPLVAGVGVGVLGGILQVVNQSFSLILLRSRCNRDLNRVRCNFIAIFPLKSHCNIGCACSFTGSQAVFIYGENLPIVSFPLIAALGICRVHRCCELNRFTHTHSFFIAADRNAFGRCNSLHRNGEFSLDRLGCIGSRGSFVRTCGSFGRLGRYREGDLGFASTHGGNRRLGCIARNWCNCCRAFIAGFPSVVILVSRARLNPGYEGERIVRIQILCISCRDTDFGRSRNRVSHCDRQFSHEFAVIVVLNSKCYDCIAHALGGDFAGFGIHLKNICVVYAPSAAFVFCTGRADLSFQHRRRSILGESDRGVLLSVHLAIDLDFGRGGAHCWQYRDLKGFGAVASVVAMLDRHRTSFLAGNRCGFAVAHNSCNILMIGCPIMIIVSSIALQLHRFANLDLVLAGDLGRLRVVQIRGVHGIVLFLRFSCLTCGCRRVSCLTCRFRRRGFLT